jgi:hypothetical protein
MLALHAAELNSGRSPHRAYPATHQYLTKPTDVDSTEIWLKTPVVVFPDGFVAHTVTYERDGRIMME